MTRLPLLSPALIVSMPPTNPPAPCTAFPSLAGYLSAPFRFRTLEHSLQARGTRCDSRSGRVLSAMIVEPLLHCPVTAAVSISFSTKYLDCGTAWNRRICRNSYLALEIHGSRTYQIAFIVRLLEGRRGLVSHHDRTVREPPFASS